MDDRAGRVLVAGIAAVDAYGIAAVDAFGRITDWNAGAARLTGYSAADATGSALSTLVSLRGEDLTSSYLMSLAEAGGEHGVWLRRRDETRFWGMVTVAPIREAGGTLTAFVVVFRDATALKAAHEEIERSRTMFEGILAIASDAVVSVDESQRIIFFNEGAERIFRYTQGEALGEPLDMLIPPRLRAGHVAKVREFGRSGVAARQMGERGAISGMRKDGEIFPAEASISQLDVGGTRVYTAVLRDVTDRRLAEEALAQQAEELARSNADLEQFAYVASHDLQEPLRMVASYTQLLARRYRGRLDDDADEFIGFAVDGVSRMQSLINDLLAYSRVGRKGAGLEPVNLEAVLEKVLATLKTTIEETGGRITHDRLPVVMGDPTQLFQLLLNLIQNGMKFSRPDRPPVIDVVAEDVGHSWQISIRDNGIGIADEFKERIFIIFQRLHSRGDYPGTGIGLAICKKIVERHHGRIWLESTMDEGTTFYFTIPKDDARE